MQLQLQFQHEHYSECRYPQHQSPNNVHAEIAIAAAKAGKHIICEKPLALTVDQAREMYLTAKENNIKTLVAFNYRKTPAVQLAKKYIEEGAIGEILDFRGTYLQDWSADPESPLSWRFQKNICGSGALGDIGTHVVDMLRFLGVSLLRRAFPRLSVSPL